MELGDDRLVLSRERSALDEEVVAFTGLLDDHGVEYVVVSGYVAILTGRARSTEDVDIVLEPLDDGEVDALVDALSEAGYWGMAMPLDEMASILADGDRFRVAERDELFPNFELWFASNPVEREALAEAILAELGEHEVRVSPIELQIAYKLRLAQGVGTTQGKDFEDALHLYVTFEGQLNRDALESYVEDLGVQEYYAELE